MKAMIEPCLLGRSFRGSARFREEVRHLGGRFRTTSQVILTLVSARWRRVMGFPTILVARTTGATGDASSLRHRPLEPRFITNGDRTPEASTRSKAASSTRSPGLGTRRTQMTVAKPLPPTAEGSTSRTHTPQFPGKFSAYTVRRRSTGGSIRRRTSRSSPKLEPWATKFSSYPGGFHA